MKTTLFLSTLALSLAAHAARPVPRPAQLARIASGVERYGIVHWGLNTFTDREWGFGDEDPALLAPARFDADQIVSACKAGGLQGLVIVAKHHDGFCLWPTKTTGHNVAKARNFRGGKGDYVKEMEQACRRHGLKFGVYVSPWDRNNALYGTERYVVDVFQAQIRELLSGDYGEIFEMWFDGANGGDGYYGGAREKRKIPVGYYRYATETFPLVRRLQPGVLIFNEMDEADMRFGGNERGDVVPHSRSTGLHFDAVWEHYAQWANAGAVEGTTFHPVEADFPLRPGWFYHAKDRGKTKSPAYLMQRYLAAVGNAASLNLGIAPNREGRLDDEDVRALRGFGALLDLFFAREAHDGERFNVVVMREDVSRGELVDDWRFLADGKEILAGPSIGIKRIRTLDKPLAAAHCELRVSSKHGAPGKTTFQRYWVDPELLAVVKRATTQSGETDTAKWMTAAVAARDRAAAVKRALDAYVQSGEIAGAVALSAVSGKVETVYAGVADPRTGRKFDAHTLFWIASMTKGVTGAAVMTCVDKGLCALDDPIEKYIPAIAHVRVKDVDAAGKPILRAPKAKMTLRACLSHVAGFPFNVPRGDKEGNDTFALAEHAQEAAKCPLERDPFVKHQYSNVDINLAGRVVEIVTGKKFEDYLQETFFDPLGMRETTFFPDARAFSNRVYVARVAAGRKYADGNGDHWARMLRADKPQQKVRTALPAGGLYATADDVMKFYCMLANDGQTPDGKRLLSHAAIVQLSTAQYPALDRYTLGLRQYGDWFGHDGALQTCALANWKTNEARLLFVQITGPWNHPFKKAWERAAGVDFNAPIKPRAKGTREK